MQLYVCVAHILLWSQTAQKTKTLRQTLDRIWHSARPPEKKKETKEKCNLVFDDAILVAFILLTTSQESWERRTAFNAVHHASLLMPLIKVNSSISLVHHSRSCVSIDWLTAILKVSGIARAFLAYNNACMYKVIRLLCHYLDKNVFKIYRLSRLSNSDNGTHSNLWQPPTPKKNYNMFAH